MATNASLSKKAMILYGLAIIAVAFIGVVAGNWFVQWRQEKPVEITLENWEINNSSALKKGDLFPDEQLVSLEGDTVMATSIFGGQKTLILFIATGCHACGMAVESWKKEVDNLPADVLVWGIGVGAVDGLRAYKESTGFPFPLYCDVDIMYAQQYDLSTFPSVVGLDTDGKVAVIMQGFAHEYGLNDYCEYMSAPRPEPEREPDSEE